ncbi:MAG TPA: hypothetical protein VGH95_03185 [Candidatus Aquirickettsiella sp.]
MGEQEFAAFLKTQSFSKENSNNKKSIDAFYCLTALIVTNYSESDLARYFLPKELTKEIKPERPNSNWRVIYWLQLLGYWATKLFGREKYQYTATTEAKKVSGALASVRESMGSDKPYLQLRTERTFIDDLHLIMKNAVKSISLHNADTSLVNLAPEETIKNVKGNSDSDAKTVLVTIPLQTTETSGKIPPPPKFNAAFENVSALPDTPEDNKKMPASLLSQIQQFSLNKLTKVQKEVKQKNATIPSSNTSDILRAAIAKRYPAIGYSDDENGDENNNDWNDQDVATTSAAGLFKSK